MAGLLGLLLLASAILVPKDNGENEGMQDPAANGILAEPEDTIDILILGDSESYCSFVPLMLWKEYGYTSYCCGTSGQNLCYAEDFLSKTYMKQSPKLVILETNMLFREFKVQNSILMRANRILPVFGNHNRWKSLTARDLNFAVNYTYIDDSKGYHFSRMVDAASSENYMSPTSERASVPEDNYHYLSSIKDYCEENGSRLLLVSTPSTVNWNMKRHNSLQQISDELGIEYMDMNLLSEEIPIDWMKDTRDKGDHLNYYGAKKATSYMGKYLFDTGMFTDHRNDDNFISWDTALAAFEKKVEEE